MWLNNVPEGLVVVSDKAAKTYAIPHNLVMHRACVF